MPRKLSKIDILLIVTCLLTSCQNVAINILELNPQHCFPATTKAFFLCISHVFFHSENRNKSPVIEEGVGPFTVVGFAEEVLNFKNILRRLSLWGESRHFLVCCSRELSDCL